jgi:hypothetical protein
MLPNRIRIPDHLILPFGTARKFDIDKIKLSSADAPENHTNTALAGCLHLIRAHVSFRAVASATP